MTSRPEDAGVIQQNRPRFGAGFSGWIGRRRFKHGLPPLNGYAQSVPATHRSSARSPWTGAGQVVRAARDLADPLHYLARLYRASAPCSTPLFSPRIPKKRSAPISLHESLVFWRPIAGFPHNPYFPETNKGPRENQLASWSRAPASSFPTGRKNTSGLEEAGGNVSF